MIVPTTLTHDQRKQQIGMLVNFAKSRYREMKDGLPVAVSEEQFVQIYLVAHNDVTRYMGKAIADQTKRKIHLA